uniref:Uncharacterized protein MANES_09G114200 n=1 Tax=Rhizophora mucronata TaxID=61149 RepID=A0A2P2IKR3_RHIMU
MVTNNRKGIASGKNKHLKQQRTGTFCLRVTRVLPAASCKWRRSWMLKSLPLTLKMRVPLTSVTVKSFSPRVKTLEAIVRSTGY